MPKTKDIKGKYISGTKVTTVCHVCLNGFLHNPATKRKYCSKSCYNKDKVKYPPFWTCEVCKIVFKKDSSSNVRKYCSRDCLNIGFKGRKMPEWFSEYRRNQFLISNPMDNPDISKKVGDKLRGRRLTPEQKRIKRITLGDKTSGENNYRWKGGILRDKLLDRIRHCFEYRIWRSEVYARDQYSCVECGNKHNIHAHHVIMLSKILDTYCIDSFKKAQECDILWDINNGQTLCDYCHSKKHHNINFFGKKLGE